MRWSSWGTLHRVGRNENEQTVWYFEHAFDEVQVTSYQSGAVEVRVTRVETEVLDANGNVITTSNRIEP